MTMKEHIKELENEWVGKRVKYLNKEYTVIGIDSNAFALIDRKTQWTDDTAVRFCDLEFVGE